MNEAEFLEHYESYKHKIYSYFCYRTNADTLLAEDLTSETFLKALKKRDQFDQTFAFSTWIFTIARNTLYDHFKKKTPETKDLENIEENELGTLNLEPQWIENLDQPLKKSAILAALNTLPELQKDCILMRYLQDKSTEEIAQITNQSNSYVRMSLSRGLKKIRPMLSPLKNIFIFFGL